MHRFQIDTGITLEQRIERIEEVLVKEGLAIASEVGTSLNRVKDYTSKPYRLKWSLGLGGLGCSKRWFTAMTVREVIEMAEKHLKIEYI